MKKKNSTLWYFLTSICVLFIAVFILLSLFMQRNGTRITDQNQQYLEDETSQAVKSMNSVMTNAASSIHMVSYLYELQLDKPEFDYHMLNTMSEPTPFDYLRFVSMDGTSWSGDGTRIDCRDREYYKEGMQGRSGVCFIPNSRFLDQAIVIFYTPLHYQGELIGVVNGVMGEKTLAEKMQSSFFGHDSDACILMRDGTVVASTWEGEERKTSAMSGLSEETLAQVRQAVAEGYPYTFRYTGEKGLGIASLSPLNMGGFTLVQTFPSTATQMITRRANQEAMELEVAMIAVFLLFILGVAFFAIRRNRRLAREKEDLSEIVDSVKRLYRRFVVFDLENDTYEYLQQGDLSLLGVPPTGQYSDWLDALEARYESNTAYWNTSENMQVEHLQETLTEENWFAHRDYQVASERWERLSLIRLDTGDGPTTRVLGAVEDITEIKKRDEEARLALETAFHAAEAASRAKSDFLSRMSHDIRTPMNAIIGLTAIMGAHLDDQERIVDCLGKITSSSKHLLALINEVLDMSKIESGKLVLSETEFSLPALVDDLLGIIQPTVNAKGQELTVHVLDMTHEDVIGDNLRLQQVFVNILSNAVKYTGEGGHISLTISETPGKRPALGEYTFVIEDDGMGMTPEFLERIFTPFERADGEQVSRIQGTGLGMSIAQSIVQLMGGAISVESELGKGSRFTVRVALKLQEVDEEAVQYLAGLPVLVADDDQVACESTCLILNELGMQGEWVLTGQEAVDRTVERHGRNEDFFAVILDWKMPGMDGVETARAIRQSVGREVPIIILSAYDWSDIENEARSAGVDAFIAKPLFKSRLRGVFTSLVSDAEPERADPLSDMREQDYSGRRVLLVEDNELNQEIAKEILEMTGLTVDVAENGKKAVESFEAEPPGHYDMIFMDIQMPVMNGYEAAKAIRALPREDAAHVPIVAMTANTFSEDVQAALAAGMDQHIGKPLDMGQLTATLEKWLT